MLIVPTEWDKFIDPAKYKPEAVSMMDFELLMLDKVLKFRFYRDTLIEIPHMYQRVVDDEHVRELMLAQQNLSKIGYNHGSVRALYRHITQIPDPK